MGFIAPVIGMIGSVGSAIGGAASTIGTVASVAGTALGAYSEYQQYKSNAALNKMNEQRLKDQAREQQRQAEEQFTDAQRASAEHKQEIRRRLGMRKAQQAGSGVMLDQGSAFRWYFRTCKEALCGYGLCRCGLGFRDLW